MREKVQPKLSKSIAKILNDTGAFTGPEASFEVVREIDKAIRKARGLIDKIDRALYDAVPDQIAEFIEDEVEDDFVFYMNQWQERIARQIHSGDYSGLEAEVIAERIVSEFFGLLDVFQVCEGLEMWEPTVLVVSSPAGVEFQLVNRYLHPLMAVTRD